MQKGVFKYVLLLLVFLVFGCAKRGSITGGMKDTIAPKMVNSLPKNFSTNFTGKEIKISFITFSYNRIHHQHTLF
jgi:hypothetical protein